MNKKVTDLEKFVLDHIYRPFQSMLPDLINGKLDGNHNLNNSVSYLEAYPEWRKCVLDRCFAIGFYFPDYIVHPLVEYIKKKRNEAHN